MQKRHTDRKRYFCELATTSDSFYVGYVKKYKAINAATRILEVGCGEGGNLLPFARVGAEVVGVDLSEARIEQARIFFSKLIKKENSTMWISYKWHLLKARNYLT
ncbi:class I SAM-dependent methyltransferase [Porphyromonas loveana]|uniref:class I SAM-dependent methyltransferase n=1 Tax=Porphyromonas loveana TaxID=1884669 RepID=UPI0035A029C2